MAHGVGPGHDAHGGVELARGQGDVDVGRFLGQGRDQGFGAPQAGGQQGFVGRGVAGHVGNALFVQAAQHLGVVFHDNGRHVFGQDLPGHDGADAAVAADDDVVAQAVDDLLHAPSPEKLLQPPFHQHLGEGADEVGERAHARDDEQHGEDAAVAGQGVDFLEPHRGKGDDDLVEAVEKAPALHLHVARDAQAEDQGQGHEAAEKRPPRAEPVVQAHGPALQAQNAVGHLSPSPADAPAAPPLGPESRPLSRIPGPWPPRAFPAPGS